jgi:cell division protein FtsZ
MPQIRPNIATFAHIKVIGVGGSGQNAVDHMISADIEGVEYVCINTDTQHLHHSKANKKIHIGKNLTKGVGAGMNPDIGRKAVEETKAEIQEVFKDVDMVFIACGMGGGTGTGAAPMIAKLAKDAGILTIAVVTKPFSFEGDQRTELARKGIEDLQKEVDALIVISNDRLLAVTDRNTSFRQAFAMCDDVLLQAVKSIADIIREKQTVNIDFADVRAVLSNAGSAFIGIGVSSGEERAEEAAERAINSPLLDVSISGAKGVLLSISTHTDDLKIFEVDTIARIVGETIDPNARFVFGPVEDNTLKKGELKVTVVATGFDQRSGGQKSIRPQGSRSQSQLDQPIFSATQPAAPEPMPVMPGDMFSQNNPLINTTTQPRPIVQPVAPKQPEPMPQPQIIQPQPILQKPAPEVLDDSDSDDIGWAVPSFIRRNK